MANTVKVRIAVAMQPDGNWNAVGWRNADDSQAEGAALSAVNDSARLVWVTASVPIPEPEVPGTVEEC